MNDEMYFAYGSNLNREDLARWCSGAGHRFPQGQSVTTACLPDWDLVFNHSSHSRGCGVLNVVRRTGCALPDKEPPIAEYSCHNKHNARICAYQFAYAPFVLLVANGSAVYRLLQIL